MSEAPPIRIAIVDDHKMLLGALTEWIRGAADDIRMVAAVASWPELLTHPEFPVDVVLLDLDLKDNIPISLKLSTLKTTGVAHGADEHLLGAGRGARGARPPAPSATWSRARTPR